MATAIYPLNKVQIGLEATKGVLVAATRLLQGDGSFTEEQEFYRSTYPVGIRATVGGAGTIMRKGFMLDFQSELTAEEVLWPLLTGVKGGVVAVGAGADKTWTFTPELATGVTTVDSATVEVIRSDGVTNHYYGEAGYCLTSAFSMDWAFNQIAKLNWKMFGRARQTDTPTAALAIYPGREALSANQLWVYLDTTWAGLGTTQLVGTVRSVKLDVDSGYGPDYTLDGSVNVDFRDHLVGALTGKLSLVMELDATGAARLTESRANSLVYIRLKDLGSTISASKKTVQVDGAYRFVSHPQVSFDGQQALVTCALESVYDSTSTKTLEFTAINALAAVA